MPLFNDVFIHEKAVGTTERWWVSISVDGEPQNSVDQRQQWGSEVICAVKACYGVWFGDDDTDKKTKTAEDV